MEREKRKSHAWHAMAISASIFWSTLNILNVIYYILCVFYILIFVLNARVILTSERVHYIKP